MSHITKRQVAGSTTRTERSKIMSLAGKIGRLAETSGQVLKAMEEFLSGIATLKADTEKVSNETERGTLLNSIAEMDTAGHELLANVTNLTNVLKEVDLVVSGPQNPPPQEKPVTEPPPAPADDTNNTDITDQRLILTQDPPPVEETGTAPASTVEETKFANTDDAPPTEAPADQTTNGPADEPKPASPTVVEETAPSPTVEDAKPTTTDEPSTADTDNSSAPADDNKAGDEPPAPPTTTGNENIAMGKPSDDPAAPASGTTPTPPEPPATT